MDLVMFCIYYGAFLTELSVAMADEPSTSSSDSNVGRVAASLTILVTSAVTIYSACLRSSTIYFYELDSTTVIFMAMPLAVVFPLLLSLALFISYLSKKPKETGVQTCESSPKLTRRSTRRISHISSDLRRITEERDDYSPTRTTSEKNQLETEKLVEKLEKEIGPIETGSGEVRTNDIMSKKTRKDSTTMTYERLEDLSEAEEKKDKIDFTLDPATEVDDLAERKTAVQSDFDDSSTALNSRRSSFASKMQKDLNKSRKISLLQKETSAIEVRKDLCELLKEVEQTNIWTYALGGFDLKIIPHRKITQFKPKHSILSLIIEILATHVPIWLCVGAFYVITLEFLRLNFAYYFYFHEDIMEFSALFLALSIGAIHEFKSHWITNDILALCSIYVVVSRLQPISFHSATALIVGFFAFDLFWLYIIDLLSTVIKESKAPVMLIVPRDNLGNKQSLATLDVMVPGVFLNLVLKYSSMYDKRLFNFDFVALFGSLLITTFLAIWRKKVTPAMVLPAIALIAASLLLTNSPMKLWKFMIKH
ncbi:unnamed protein product, partial [Mesorhabditis belari]|uniref:Uncharacterized protein n=1 Tax=Mesorhabditis belari TaxID=2138241 RepID=A0AAF3JAW7_9BILA